MSDRLISRTLLFADRTTFPECALLQVQIEVGSLRSVMARRSKRGRNRRHRVWWREFPTSLCPTILSVWCFSCDGISVHGSVLGESSFPVPVGTLQQSLVQDGLVIRYINTYVHICYALVPSVLLFHQALGAQREELHFSPLPPLSSRPRSKRYGCLQVDVLEYGS